MELKVKSLSVNLSKEGIMELFKKVINAPKKKLKVNIENPSPMILGDNDNVDFKAISKFSLDDSIVSCPEHCDLKRNFNDFSDSSDDDDSFDYNFTLKKVINSNSNQKDKEKEEKDKNKESVKKISILNVEYENSGLVNNKYFLEKEDNDINKVRNKMINYKKKKSTILKFTKSIKVKVECNSDRESTKTSDCLNNDNSLFNEFKGTEAEDDSKDDIFNKRYKSLCFTDKTNLVNINVKKHTANSCENNINFISVKKIENTSEGDSDFKLEHDEFENEDDNQKKLKELPNQEYNGLRVGVRKRTTSIFDKMELNLSKKKSLNLKRNISNKNY